MGVNLILDKMTAIGRGFLNWTSKHFAMIQHGTVLVRQIGHKVQQYAVIS